MKEKAKRKNTTGSCRESGRQDEKDKYSEKVKTTENKRGKDG